jgi:hypothetical protein
MLNNLLQFFDKKYISDDFCSQLFGEGVNKMKRYLRFKMMMIVKIIIFVLLFMYPNLTFAWSKSGTTYTTDGSYSDVSSAISNASAGDTVTLPSGTFDSKQGWSSTLTIQKNIILQGTGGYPTANTILQSTANPVILLNNANASGIRITGIKFNDDSGSTIRITAPVVNFRFDHCHFNQSSGGGICVDIDTYGSLTIPIQGLVDNCRLDYSRFYLAGYSSGSYLGFETWSNNTNLGGATAIYVEDCVAYNYKDGPRPWHFMDGNMAAGYVSRYNKLYGYYFEAHGPEHEGGNRGIRKWEIYRNYMYSDYSEVTYRNQDSSFHLRAGTGVLFQNEHIGFNHNLFYFPYYRWNSSRGPAGQCNGKSPYDNNDDATGWLCLDQPGAGRDTATRTEGNPYVEQEKQPIYVWGNTTGGSANNAVSVTHNRWEFNDWFQSDQDVFIEGYGSVGMSSGPLAKRPATCTVGQGYWATDQGSWNKATTGDWAGQQGVLYKCTSTDTWTLYYTPYTYPHPLRGQGGESPSPPSGLRIIQ